MPSGDPTIHCVFMQKRGGDWGNSCKHSFQRTTKVRGHKESTLTDYHSFQDLSAKFSHSKAIHFHSFLSLFYCRKSPSKTTLMSLNCETAFKQEITRWRHLWSVIRPPDDPLVEILVETLCQTNTAFYRVGHFLLTLFRRVLLSTVSAR